ncbi:hypothetical protein PoB_000701900 [Plakobranchus ocellatus]|uniref:Uncharacterized protein n=1 Tax=Plakobranchus ocellatus TaxID=259542 RepID=A0AAV3YEL3_9GAST|nr:hypothetical protein PoB_000701900 [Plakobranchus ocellatus]
MAEQIRYPPLLNGSRLSLEDAVVGSSWKALRLGRHLILKLHSVMVQALPKPFCKALNRIGEEEADKEMGRQRSRMDRHGSETLSRAEGWGQWRKVVVITLRHGRRIEVNEDLDVLATTTNL